MPEAYFTPDFLRFLSELSAHNERGWFQANKALYERAVRDPFLRFLTDLAPNLRKISPQFVVDPSPTGGSMMRIYRDTRFSKDKTPFKTAVAARFSHAKAKEGAMPAFHLRLEPGRSSVGAGIWRPEGDALKRIRKAIVQDTKTWERITTDRVLKSGCGMEGESLKRPPAGFDPNHPFIEDVKRKDFGMSVPLEDRIVVEGTLMKDVVQGFKAAAPFLCFLTKAVGLPF